MAETKKKYSNYITVKGILAEKNLEIKQTKTGKTYINGTIVVKTGEDSLHKLKVNTYEKTKDGSINQMYTGLVTVMNEHKSIASHGDDADAVEVRAQLDVDDYKGRDGRMVCYVSKVVSTVKRIPKDGLEVEAKGTAHVFIEKSRMEVTKDGDETGRAVVSGYIRKFNGELFPVEFKLANPKGVELFVHGGLERGALYECVYELVNSTVTTTKVEEFDFGETQTNVITNTVNENLIVSARRGNETLAYTTEEFNKALVERELKLKEIENGTSSTGATPAPAQVSKPKVDDFEF